MTTLVFHDEATDEYDAAAAFYEARQSGLGMRFRAAVVARLRSIRAYPKIGTAVSGTDCRKVLVSRFPYKLIYSEEPTCILIVAVAHASRDPNYWQNRITP